jgi:hypothetical protein
MMNVLKVLCVVVVLAVVSAGCLSTHGASGRLVHMEIKDVTIAEVRAETLKVFKAEYYEIMLDQSDQIVFERDANSRDSALWGNYGNDLRMKVEVQFQDSPRGGVLLSADAFTIRTDFGREEKLRRMARRPYQQVLNRIKKNLAK